MRYLILGLCVVIALLIRRIYQLEEKLKPTLKETEDPGFEAYLEALDDAMDEQYLLDYMQRTGKSRAEVLAEDELALQEARRHYEVSRAEHRLDYLREKLDG